MSIKFAKNALAAVVAALSLASVQAVPYPPLEVDALSKITIKMDADNEQKVQSFVVRVARGEAIPECAAGVSTRCMQSADLSRLWFRGYVMREGTTRFQKFTLIAIKGADGIVTVSNAALYPAYTIKGFGTLSKADSSTYFGQDFKRGCWLNNEGHCPGAITRWVP